MHRVVRGTQIDALKKTEDQDPKRRSGGPQVVTRSTPPFLHTDSEGEWNQVEEELEGSSSAAEMELVVRKHGSESEAEVTPPPEPAPPPVVLIDDDDDDDDERLADESDCMV